MAEKGTYFKSSLKQQREEEAAKQIPEAPIEVSSFKSKLKKRRDSNGVGIQSPSADAQEVNTSITNLKLWQNKYG